MSCKGCQSNEQSVFNGEIAIHFSGHEALDRPMVFVFPKIVVCFRCGFAEFAIPDRELQVLEHGSPVKGAAVLTEKVARPYETKIKSASPGMNR